MSESRTDIETFGIEKVCSVLRKAKHLSPRLNAIEKSPGYDGYVSIIDQPTEKIEDEIGRVFVQVKTRSRKRKQENDRIIYSIEKKYICTYLRNYPLIYFVVHKFDDDSFCIYYKELQKIDLFNLSKVGSERVQVYMKRLTRQPAQLDDLFLHFYDSAKVQEMIAPEHQISIIELAAGGFNAHLKPTTFHPEDFNLFSLFKNGNITFWGERDNILYHIDTEGLILNSVKIPVDCILTASNKVFFSKAEFERTDDKATYYFSDSVKLIIENGDTKRVSLNYHIPKDLGSLVLLLNLFLAINETGGCNIEMNRKTDFCRLNSIPTELIAFCKESLPKYEHLQKVLAFFHVNEDIDVSQVKDSEYETVCKIYDSIDNGTEIELSGHHEDTILVSMNLAEIKLAFVAIKQPSGQYRMHDVLGDEKNRFAFLYSSGDEKGRIVPIETGLRESSIWSCANFNKEHYLKTLKDLLVEDSSLGVIINDYDFLPILKEYDDSKKSSLLVLALELSTLLETYSSDPLYVLNRLQVKKRKGVLTESEKDELIDILSCDVQIYKIAAYLLLDKKKKAKELLEKMNEEDQKGILDYPISMFL